MRGEPQSGFASAMVRTSSASSELTRGRPTRPRRDFHVRKRGSLAGASESRSGANDMERLAPPRPLVGEPHPEETLEAPELRSLRPAAKQDELLPQRQIFEREVSAGSERRTQRAQQRWDEEAALSDRADSLPVLTHSTVQGERTAMSECTTAVIGCDPGDKQSTLC